MASNEEILAAINGIKTDIAVIKATSVEGREMIKKHEHVIYGNGVPGLKTRLVGLEQKKKSQDFWINMALGGVIVALVKSFMSLVLHKGT